VQTYPLVAEGATIPKAGSPVVQYPRMPRPIQRPRGVVKVRALMGARTVCDPESAGAAPLAASPTAAELSKGPVMSIAASGWSAR